jgi:PAS domain S-box-containing protein
MSYDHWRKEKLQGTIDNILLIKEYPIEMVTYIRNDWPELIPIWNKVLVALQKDDLPRIINKWFGKWPRLSTSAKFSLTEEERAWIDKKNTVQVRVVDFPPYIFAKKGKEPSGISIDYLNLIAMRTGIKFKYNFSTHPLTEALKSMENRKGPDLIAAMMRTSDREKKLSFSKDYQATPRVIFTRTEKHFISSMDDLLEKKIAIPRGRQIQKEIRMRYPDLKLLLFDTDKDALESVATHKADAYIGNLVVASYIILQRGYANLKVAAPSPFGDHVLSFGSRKDWPELISIINKGLDSITPEEKAEIRSKHMKLKYEYGIKPGYILKWVLIVVGSTSLMLLLFLFWNRSLAKKVRERTSELTSSHKFLEAEIDERKQVERKYRTVADFTYDWEYWVNMDGTLEYISPSCERISGYSVQDFMANPSLLRDIIVPEDRGIWDQHMNDSIKDLALKEVQFRIKNKDGDIRWIEHASRPIIDRQGSLDSFRANNRDITIRKQIEISLQASREKAETLAAKLISTQEAGSARLARELHDDIIQRLAFLKIEVDKLEMKNPSLPEPAGVKLRQIARDIGVLSSDIHMISRRLHPITLEILGLVRSIETECQNFTRLKEIPVTLDLDDTVQYPSKEISLCTYRILQESLRNIVRHAKATGVDVTLSKKNDILHLSIKDNGIGFDPASDGVKAGLGIASMTERARLLQGSLSIESRPGNGTVIKLKLPFASR